METRITYDRTYSIFEPDYTYNVRDGGRLIGAVARMQGSRVWHASNRSWSGGADLPGTYPTRTAAADALYHAAAER